VRVVHDISVTVGPGMHIYPGNPATALERVDAIADGATANVSKLDLGVHSGTHVDAAVHFIDGAPGTEALSLDVLVGRAVVVDATSVADELDERALVSLELPAEERLLLKTTNSALWARPSFSPEFLRLTGSGARYLVARDVRLIGIDYLSIGDEEAHRELLGAGVVALEGLDLRNVEPGAYELACLPLKLEGSDGAPARAVLLR